MMPRSRAGAQPSDIQLPRRWHQAQAMRCKELDLRYSPAPGSAYRKALVIWYNSHTALADDCYG